MLKNEGLWFIRKHLLTSMFLMECHGISFLDLSKPNLKPSHILNIMKETSFK